MRRALLCLTTLAAIACMPAAAPLSEEDVAAIKALGPALDEAAFANDVDGILSLFTDDAVFMPPNAPVVSGRAEYAPWIEAALSSMSISVHSIELTDVEGAGDFAVAWGVFSEEFTLEGAEEPFVDQGKILFLLRRQEDGSWRFTREIWNSDLPLPAK